MSANRYRSIELPYGVTREAIGWLGPKKQHGIVVTWVREHFSRRDPDHLLFDDTDTWSVFEQARDEFEGLVPDDVLESALDQLPGDWVPHHTPRKSQVEHYDVRRLDELLTQARSRRATKIGHVIELHERVRLEAIVADLRRNITEIEGIVGRLGGNGGPTDTSSAAGQFAHVTSQFAKVAKQISSSAPNPISIAESAVAIQGIALENGWLGEAYQDGAKAYIRSFCETAAKDHAHVLNAALMMFVFLVFQLLIGCVEWLEIATAH